MASAYLFSFLISRHFRFFLQQRLGKVSLNLSRLRELWELEDKISYRFRNWELFNQALTHKSYTNEVLENSDNHYERLEFLGDSVLDLVLSSLLIKKYPHANEGELSKRRSSLVNENRLAQLGYQFNLGRYLLLGKGEEQTRGRHKHSILACVYEALIGAIYLDGGYRRVARVVHAHFNPLLSFEIKRIAYRDFKSRLQEYVQITFKTVPQYILVREAGPSHNKEFEVNIVINSQSYGTGRGKNKKEAQQRAASATLKQLGC